MREIDRKRGRIGQDASGTENKVPGRRRRRRPLPSTGRSIAGERGVAAPNLRQASSWSVNEKNKSNGELPRLMMPLARENASEFCILWKESISYVSFVNKTLKIFLGTCRFNLLNFKIQLIFLHNVHQEIVNDLRII